MAQHRPLTRAEQDQEVKCRPLETLCLWTGTGAGTCWTAADPTQRTDLDAGTDWVSAGLIL